jgi:hypothetical protein
VSYLQTPRDAIYFRSVDRVHAYQGAVYLEEASASDHCFRVLAKSHDQHEEFFKKFPSVGPKTRENEFHPLNELERKWYIEEKKCKLDTLVYMKPVFVRFCKRIASF